MYHNGCTVIVMTLFTLNARSPLQKYNVIQSGEFSDDLKL